MESNETDTLKEIDKIISRMGRNFDRGVGIHLSYKELELLSISIFGELWSAPSEYEEQQ